LLAPCEPTKIVVVGLTTRNTQHESAYEIPDEPMISIKPASAVIGPGDAIVYPKSSTRVDPEAESAVVIGKRAHEVPTAGVDEYILGYTCFNDVMVRDLQGRDKQWMRGKGFDAFAPMGSWVVPHAQPGGRELLCLVNGEVR